MHPNRDFGSLAQAVRDRTAEPERNAATPTDAQRPAGAGVHKPAAALNAVSETLRDHITRLEAELAQSQTVNTSLHGELTRAKSLRDKAGDAAEEFVFLDPSSVEDHLPKDRLRGRAEGREFDELLADIERNGQNDAITVRRTSNTYEVAAGRRRLEACKRLQRKVLARVRDLDDQAMLRIQFSENERRTDISALERARWFAEVRDRLKTSAKEIAAQFGVDPSTFSLYLRIARFPDEILERLEEPRRLAVIPARRVMEAIESDPTAVSSGSWMRWTPRARLRRVIAAHPTRRLRSISSSVLLRAKTPAGQAREHPCRTVAILFTRDGA